MSKPDCNVDHFIYLDVANKKNSVLKHQDSFDVLKASKV